MVKVISQNDLYTEVEEKIADWLNAGTRMVTVVNARRRNVKVYRSVNEVQVLGENEPLDGGDVVPGWTLLVQDMFA